MRTSALFSEKKLRIFRNLWLVRTDKGGFEQMRTFFGHGRGQFFFDFVRMSYMDYRLCILSNKIYFDREHKQHKNR